MNWLKRFLPRFRSSKPAALPGELAPSLASEQRIKKLMHAIIATSEVELGCDEVLQFIDQYAEAIERGENPEQWMPLVSQHMDICGECEEELQAVLEILRSIPPEATT
jgi:hypothetical protein